MTGISLFFDLIKWKLLICDFTMHHSCQIIVNIKFHSSRHSASHSPSDLAVGQVCSFLVRPSDNTPGDYSLFFRTSENIQRFKISPTPNNQYMMGGRYYNRYVNKILLIEAFVKSWVACIMDFPLVVVLMWHAASFLLLPAALKTLLIITRKSRLSRGTTWKSQFQCRWVQKWICCIIDSGFLILLIHLDDISLFNNTDCHHFMAP